MKLHELVAFRNQLDTLSVMPAQEHSIREMNLVHYTVQDCAEQFVNFQTNFRQQSQNIIDQFQKFEDMLVELRQQVNQLIEQEEKPWFQESYKLYDKDMRRETPEYILNRRENLSESVETVLTTRLKNYTDWRFPAMIVRPGLESFIKTMVPNDPLYLIDQHRDLLTPAISSFPDSYQRRLRAYVVNEREDLPILHKIPDNQFGLCLVYNFFNFRPIEVIRQWLGEIFVKLKSGGVLVMTINDCDQPAGVVLAENYFACYTPRRLILSLVQSIGFEVLHVWNDTGPMTWIELRKPGQLNSLRGGQTLAKIIGKPVA